LLRNPRVQQYINRSRGRIHLFVYQSTEEIEDIGRKFGWNIIGNPTTIRREFGHKGEFRRILKQLDLPLIPGEQISRDELIRRGYHSLCLSLGKDMVFQLPDITKGGGRGTFFIRSEKDYLDFTGSRA
jgi:hypothetical protein